MCGNVFLISSCPHVFFDRIGKVFFIIAGDFLYMGHPGNQIFLAFGEIVAFFYHPRDLLCGNRQGFNGIRLRDVAGIQDGMLQNPGESDDAQQYETDFGMPFAIQ